MSRIDDLTHYQHTTRPTVPPAPRVSPREYRRGDFVTVVPSDEDAWLLHMQRHVNVVDEPTPGCYRVRLGSTSEDAAIQGPIPAERLLPGWVDQDGIARRDVRGRVTRGADPDIFNGGGLAPAEGDDNTAARPVRLRRRLAQTQPRDVV